MSNENIPKFDVLPQHIGFIMYGNGRWATERGLERSEGHKAGAKTYRKIVEYCSQIGIKYVTFYAFSTENWNRPKKEVAGLMKLFKEYLLDGDSQLSENDIHQMRLNFIGERKGLPKDLLRLIEKAERETAKYNRFTVNIALNYGGRAEITHAVKEIAQKVKNGEMSVNDITETTVSNSIYTAGQPDPDIIVRPSGEYRISNFLIWQSAYSEFWYSNVLWPDFSEEDVNQLLIDYQNRNRRFGGV
ncbi:MAG: isoprenyl transferase [Oscillospiraceae bacterium]|nr:isoprenyl transferase [Oscillospiraceae bacterium]